MNSKYFNIITSLSLFLVSAETFTQQEVNTDIGNPLGGAALFLISTFLLVLIIIFIYPKFDHSKQRLQKRLKVLDSFFNRAVPVDKEDEIKIEHAFDGIHELNNKIPPWFNILFYGSIVFAVVYLIDYHVLGSGNIMIDEYVTEVKVANEKREEMIKSGAFISENNVVLLSDASEIDKGSQLFKANCSACHGMDAGGIVGPNLTDKYWIHGGGIKNVFTTVKNGVPVKGMISWKSILNPKQMQQVSSYILSLEGTTPAVSKPPEGNIWIDSSMTGKDSITVKDKSEVKK
jgi:cytochrome c oxidase cbb3-type subunit 3